jgi:NTP pyrophosphatase (non-canonical NTP hydrolase)
MITDLHVLQQSVRNLNEEKGWRDQARTLVEDLALLHSEVSEALEAWRTFGDVQPHLDYQADQTGAARGKPVGVGSEMADVLIRLLDTCDRFGIDLPAELAAKMAFNWTRPRRHGDKHI